MRPAMTHDPSSVRHKGLRTKPMPAHFTPDMKRFDIFLIDTEWNVPVSKAVRHFLRNYFDCHPKDTLYELSREQSFEIIKHDPKVIGHDPTLVLYDLYASGSGKTGNYRGFRLNLGLMRNGEQALARLQEFIRFVALNRTVEHLDREVRRELQREGIEGIVKILRETSVDLLVE
jgi:hypothetical protein